MPSNAPARNLRFQPTLRAAPWPRRASHRAPAQPIASRFARALARLSAARSRPRPDSYRNLRPARPRNASPRSDRATLRHLWADSSSRSAQRPPPALTMRQGRVRPAWALAQPLRPEPALRRRLSAQPRFHRRRPRQAPHSRRPLCGSARENRRRRPAPDARLWRARSAPPRFRDWPGPGYSNPPDTPPRTLHGRKTRHIRCTFQERCNRSPARSQDESRRSNPTIRRRRRLPCWGIPARTRRS